MKNLFLVPSCGLYDIFAVQQFALYIDKYRELGGCQSSCINGINAEEWGTRAMLSSNPFKSVFLPEGFLFQNPF